MSNIVFIATSLDGYIADKNGSLDWLNEIEPVASGDMGYNDHMERIDALVMGRNTLEMVLSFDIEWPYHKPVYVLSNTLSQVPLGYEDKVFLIKGPLKDVIKQLHLKGLKNLYIDGGITIQNFLKEDLIDEIIITSIPILLGGGASLFGELEKPLHFEHLKSERFDNAIIQNHYRRARSH